MQAIFFALISFLGWGIGDVFGTIASRKIGGLSTAFWYIIFQLIIFLLAAPFFLTNLSNISANTLLLNLSLGVLNLVGLITFYESLRIGNAAIAGTISSSYAAVTVVLSLIFLNEKLLLLQTISITAVFLGVAITGLDLKELQKGKALMTKSLISALVAAVIFGIYWTFIKFPIREIGWYWPQILSMSTIPLLFVYIKLRNLRLAKPDFKGAIYPLILTSLLIGLGSFSFNIAISKGQTSIVAPVAGSYPILFAILAWFVFRDPITRQQILGIIVTLIGIVLLSMHSV